jgi:RNA polymerase sigma-70 factor (sigma-E family)
VERSAEADFESFVARSGRSLLRTAWLITGDQGHAEDIVQTALERTARHWTGISGEPEAYARRSVVNLATDRWRRRSARVSEIPLGSGPTAAGAAPDATSLVDLRHDLLSDLRSLPPRERAVLVLRYFNDLDEAATAQALGVSVGTVKSSASRGLSRLRTRALDRDREPTGMVIAEGAS